MPCYGGNGHPRPVSTMVAAVSLAALLQVASLWSASLHHAWAQTFTPGDESPEQYPAGAGRDQAFYTCTPCHGFRIVAQQRQSSAQWDETLNIMTARFGMPKLDGADRMTVLEYLASAFPPRTAPGGWRNPFSKP